MRTSSLLFVPLCCSVAFSVTACSSSPVPSSAPSISQTGISPSLMHPHLGGKPFRVMIPNLNFTFDAPAGQACPSFELAGVPVTNKQVATIFPVQPNGDQLQIVTGTVVEQLTNVNTGKSTTVNISGPTKLIIHADGSVSESLTGPGLVVLTPGVSIPPGPGAFHTTGHIEVFVNATLTQFTILSQTGTQEDLCAQLT